MLAVAARRAWQVLGQPRSTQRYRPAIPEAEAALRAAIEVARHIHAADVLHGRTRLLAAPGGPAPLRADIGPEFTARAVRTWLARVGAQTLVIEPGSPWAIG